MTTPRKDLAAAARAAGERYFEDPRGCKRGHQVFYASNGCCTQCANLNKEIGFETWANGRGLTGHIRDVARAAWDAAQARRPPAVDRICGVLARGPKTAPQIAAELRVSPEHVRRLLRENDIARKDGLLWRKK